jgi:hypothetical protein
MTSRYDPEFDRLVMSAPIVDNAGSLYVIGQLEPDTSETECDTCQGDGCDWHLSPTNGATEIDRACPACEGTGRTHE